MTLKNIFEGKGLIHWRLRLVIQGLFQLLPIWITYYLTGIPDSSTLFATISLLVSLTILSHALFLSFGYKIVGKSQWKTIKLKDYLISLLAFSFITLFAIFFEYMDVSGWNYLGMFLMRIFS